MVKGRSGDGERDWQRALSTEGSLFGTFLHVPSPQLVEIIAAAGFDFVILDLEHGEFGISRLAELQRAADAGGISGVVRVPSNDASLIGKAFDLGADAVLVPHIETAEDAARAVAAAKYAPEGSRGAFPFMRASGYRSAYRPGWEAEQNAATSVIVLVEGERGIANIEQIVRVPGVTSVFVGPVDLSQALGLPGQLRHPRVEAFAHGIRETAVRAGLHASIFCNDLEAAVEYATAGFKLIAFSVDSQIILEAYRACANRFAAGMASAREAAPTPTPPGLTG